MFSRFVAFPVIETISEEFITKRKMKGIQKKSKIYSPKCHNLSIYQGLWHLLNSQSVKDEILKQIHSLGDEQYKRLMVYMKALQKLEEMESIVEE